MAPASEWLAVPPRVRSRTAEETVNKTIRRMILIGMAILALGAGLIFAPARETSAQTAELHVMISDGLKSVVEELTPQIEKAVERKLAIDFNSSKNLRDKIQAGESFDATFLTADVLDDLIQKGKVTGATRADISRTGIGVGVRAGAPKPDVSTPDALKRALLAAKSISFNPTGASAAPTFDIFSRLGIADEVKPKLVLDKEAGRPQKNVAEGKVDLVISLIPEIKFFPGVDLAGPMPGELQNYVKFAGGLGVNARDAEGAKRMIQFLKGKTAAEVMKAKGMEPL
jgi:molybdate transport system substrate-binding protein